MNHVRPLLRPVETPVHSHTGDGAGGVSSVAKMAGIDASSGMEQQWCEKHVEEMLREFRRALRRPRESVRVDLADEGGRFMFPPATEGVVAREFGSYRHVIVGEGEV